MSRTARWAAALMLSLGLVAPAKAEDGYRWHSDAGGRAAVFGVPGQARILVRVSCSPRRRLTLTTPLAVELPDNQSAGLVLLSSAGRSKRPAEVLSLSDGAYLAVPLKSGDDFLVSLGHGRSVSLQQGDRQLDLPGEGAPAALNRVLRACRPRA